MGRNDGQSSQSLRETASRCAGSKGHAWFVRGLRGARLAALAAALRRQSVKGGKGTATAGEIGRFAADVHITRHSAKSPRSLRCASLLGSIAAASPTRPSCQG